MNEIGAEKKAEEEDEERTGKGAKFFQRNEGN